MGKKDRRSRPQQPQQVPRKHPTRFVIAGAVIGVCAVLAFLVNRNRPEAEPQRSKTTATAQTAESQDFAGSEACARCHQKQYALWKDSTHGLAGGEPGQASIIARFDGQPLYFRDAVVTPTKTPKGEYLFLVEQE